MRIAIISFIAFCSFATNTNAQNTNSQSSFFAPENISGWVDVRYNSTNGEKSWLDGGFGKLRNSDRLDNFHLAEAAIVWTPRISNDFTAYVQLQHTTAAGGASGINEAYIKYRPIPKSNFRYSGRIGQFYPHISLEHDGRGWTTPRTITPSMINSWIGEEIIVKGAEVSIENKIAENTFGLTLGAFKANDTAGTLLIFRGWAHNDIRTSSAQKLPLTSGPAGFKNMFTAQAHYSIPLTEVDDKTGYYGRLDWKLPLPIAFNAEYYTSNGNPEIVIRGQYGWDTKFQNFGLQYDISENTQVLSQYLSGTSAMGFLLPSGFRDAEISYESAYFLITHKLENDLRLTARADVFSVDDKSWLRIDNNNEDGQSYTLALVKPLNKNTELKLELLNIKSDRPAREVQATNAKQNQTSFQAALKFHF